MLGNDSPGTLKEGEYHPAADAAKIWLATHWTLENICLWEECFASTALSGNRLSEICLETLRRVKDKKPVSDKYLLGLVWTLKEIPEKLTPPEEK